MAMSSCTLRGSTTRATPSRVSAIRMAGTVSWMSASRMTTASTQPPRKPASRPSSTPVVTDSTMAASPIISDTRLP